MAQPLPEENIALLPKPGSGAKIHDEEVPGCVKPNSTGFTTRQALSVLEKIMDEEQEKFYKSRRWQTWLTDALHHNSPRSIFNWTEVVLFLLQVVLAVVTLSTQSQSDRIFVDTPEAVAVLVILLGFMTVNVALSCWEARSRHLELWRQLNVVIEMIRRDLLGMKKFMEWKSSYYPHLHLPESPSISLQWTYRDGQLVNLPVVLLVPGDVISVRPSQTISCKCTILDDDTDEVNKNLTLQVGDIFQPDAEGELESPLAPVERVAAADRRFRVLEAPFKAVLQESLSAKPLHRPSSVIEKQRVVTYGYIERRLLPIMLVLYLIGNVVEICVFRDGFRGRWVEEFVYANLYVLVPLSPLIFPSLWMALNYVILARVLAVFHKFKRKKFKHDSLHEAKLTDPIYVVKSDWGSTWTRFRSFVQGNNESLYQTSNIVHTLGNVTAVCCMDKKGILSWPNPNAEKITVLRSRGESVTASKVSLRLSTSSLQETVYNTEETLSAKNYFDRHNSLSVVTQEPVGGALQVLDITQSGGRAFEIEFDDSLWTNVMSSLKPLGLGILLNTCNEDVLEYYRAFTDHVSCVALHHDQTVPVVNRRCLCSLSRLVGFTPSAEKIFKQIHRMAFYRKPPKTPRELEGRYKSPFPNMLSIITKDLKSGGLHVMSQGTADLLLDTCSDYWNGQEVRALTEDDRKQILEFYTRFSMTAYCTAFAYSPMTVTVAEHESDSDSDAEDTFIELPMEDDDLSVQEVSSQRSAPADSSVPVRELYENCCKNQVFLGCVAQQYQSRNEFVHLIDLLEQACIRFIHFSTETELRSRVFAERLGLESGWNCHISLDSQGIDPFLEQEQVQQLSSPITASPRKTTIVVEPEINLENRARLPRGIENMREHIELVDNVPLLVSLFTDCTSGSIKEMIAIMQENGEVVCCLGSSANLSNSSVFLQADASIGIDPMYPQTCFSSAAFVPATDRKQCAYSPMDLMRILTSLNCSLCCQKEDPLSLMQLIIESRHNLSVLRNCFKFLISAGLSLVALHTLCNLVCLPPSLSLGHLLLLVCLTVPFLSLALLSAPHDRNLIRISTGKNRSTEIVNRESVLRFVRTFLLRWLPSMFVILLCQSLLLSQNCKTGPLSCYPVLPELQEPKAALRLTQNFSGLLAFLYFGVISMGYGNNKPGFWKYSQLKNKFWVLAFITGLLLQLVYFFSDTRLLAENVGAVNGTVSNAETRILPTTVHWFFIPLWVWLVGFLWPFLLLPVNELIKKFELAELDKQQKRARLQFGTKLGMNSPF